MFFQSFSRVIIYCLITSLVLSCSQAKQKLKEKQHADTINIPKPKDSSVVQSVSKEESDSILFLPLMNYALDLASKNWYKSVYEVSFDTVTRHSILGVSIDIQTGNFFSPLLKHLIIRLHAHGGAITSVYKWTNKNFELIVQHDQSDLTYIKDTISDVNGDGYKDFLVHWYPSAGCCLRNLYSVYLYLPNRKTFTSKYEFINPTFFPKEKMIRGLEYGHMEEVGIYKYKWDGLQVKEIEFIYADQSRQGYFIKTKSSMHRPTVKDGIRIKGLPKEYHSIEDINWMLSYYADR